MVLGVEAVLDLVEARVDCQAEQRAGACAVLQLRLADFSLGILNSLIVLGWDDKYHHLKEFGPVTKLHKSFSLTGMRFTATHAQQRPP